ncbi:hypothetical protein P167DRAFT_562580 [Morchella conica CCBAS932]|uniref:Uncharacterized protein n=1 Tax=Morchella conica CCBAS932 TaxID=1392247 RepID=A0A3N4L3T7_9PEZI|nr:hypothetical protein P167DRAFT_562580 [Morchella conica CCBAS932]
MEKLQRHVSGFQPGDSPAAATPDYVEYWTPRNPDPGTPSELYGTPRVDNDSTPMKQNPETPRPHFTHYQPVNSFDHDIQSPLGTYTNPVYIDGEDTEMVDAESIPPGPELVFPANPTIESEHEEDYNPISSPPRFQYTNSTIMSTTTMGAEKVPVQGKTIYKDYASSCTANLSQSKRSFL